MRSVRVPGEAGGWGHLGGVVYYPGWRLCLLKQ